MSLAVSRLHTLFYGLIVPRGLPHLTLYNLSPATRLLPSFHIGLEILLRAQGDGKFYHHNSAHNLKLNLRLVCDYKSSSLDYLPLTTSILLFTPTSIPPPPSPSPVLISFLPPPPQCLGDSKVFPRLLHHTLHLFPGRKPSLSQSPQNFQQNTKTWNTIFY